ncbi:SDR family oxidoreductase [Phytohabitans kaempferiae]|uniref:SDR family oxidoreductase n=1 Tax=Phytohabitans kaempferiae TaxID=1620943 RepID=A0ABV6MFA4_9ACTN
MRTLSGRTMLISGGSRGIGLAIATRAARDGANVALFGKTGTPHPTLPGTVYTAAEEIRQAGGRVLPMVADARDAEQVAEVVAATVAEFGGIDICVNNASAINLRGASDVSLKSLDLMTSINIRGTAVLTQHCLPHLRRSSNGHILTMSPPLNLSERWLGAHIPYTVTKYAMTLFTLGVAEELRSAGVAANCLWPHTLIGTAAVANLLGGEEALARSRTPAIVAEAAYEILSRDSREFTGRSVIDDELLASAGFEDFSSFAVSPNGQLELDLFVDSAPLP